MKFKVLEQDAMLSQKQNFDQKISHLEMSIPIQSQIFIQSEEVIFLPIELLISLSLLLLFFTDATVGM